MLHGLLHLIEESAAKVTKDPNPDKQHNMLNYNNMMIH